MLCIAYIITMILAVNRRFFAKVPKIASDKLAFLCSQINDVDRRRLHTRLTFMYG